jgi:hypothetical protein
MKELFSNVEIGEFLYTFVLPVLTGFLGWIYSSYRNRQKKEHDILDNVERILKLQDEHVKKTEQALERSDKLCQRIEAKYDRKSKSVRAANKCKFTNEGDGCPVLLQEEKNEYIYHQDCSECEYSKATTAE